MKIGTKRPSQAHTAFALNERTLKARRKHDINTTGKQNIQPAKKAEPSHFESTNFRALIWSNHTLVEQTKDNRPNQEIMATLLTVDTETETGKKRLQKLKSILEDQTNK